MIDAQRVLIVLPVRLGSTRLPQKALLDQTGIPLVVHAAQQATLSKYADQIVIAGDADEIRRAVTPFGFDYAETGVHHTSGSSRCAEVLDTHPADIVVNVQGDEPTINPKDIKKVINTKKKFPNHVVCGYDKVHDFENPSSINLPKVVVNSKGELIYISRALVPGKKKSSQNILQISDW